MAKKIRVMIVDDSAFMRKMISDVLSSDDEIEIVGTAKNGNEAVKKAKELNPDVITLDVEMPVMDGLTCLKELNKIKQYSVVMLSSFTREGEKATIEALENGAIDFITKPTNIFHVTGDEKKQEIINKVKVANSVAERKKLCCPRLQVKPKSDVGRSSKIRKIVAIGTSTGGPRALQDVIPVIPGDVPAAFLVVQHMPPGFTKSLATRLNSISELTVKEAEDGEIIKPGFVYIAPGDYHMKFERLGEYTIKIKLSNGLPVGGHRPSVDVMLDSLSNTKIDNIIAVIMTGMGADGSEGIKKIKHNNNGYIISQDEESSVVYGMPKAAYLTGAVDVVVTLKDISKEIMRIVGVY
ncbi:MAG: protein-glutamate methylesterase/protein-glutamine glutaminase [Acetivibrionales bacterium]|jgi:two-component system chemotaxis response regulator CheB